MKMERQVMRAGMRVGAGNSLLLALGALQLCGDSVTGAVVLKGAGASFPAEVYRTWIPNFRGYRQQFLNLEMSYAAVGSGAGKSRIKEPDVHRLTYAGSDSPLSEEDFHSHPDLKMFPMLAGAVVVGFNLPGISSLNLSRHHIVGIFNGSYKWWNDPDIQQLNPGVTLPQAQIVPIARADKSGTTEVFTKALSSFSEAWAEQYGHFSKGLDDDDNPILWNSSVVDMYGRTDIGVTGLLLSLRYSVAYLSIASALTSRIDFATVQNKAGNIVKASAESVQAAMDDRVDNFTEHFTADLVDAEGEYSYPIAAYTYFIIYITSMSDCSSARELYRYVHWALFNERIRGDTIALHFVPLSENIAGKVMGEILSEFKCKGTFVSSINSKQLKKERIAMQKWRVPVYVATPIATLAIIILACFVIWQQVKFNMALQKNKWKLPYDQIKFGNQNERLSSRSNVSMGSSRTTATKWGLGRLKAGVFWDNTVCLRSLNRMATKTFRKETKRTMLHWKNSINHLNVNTFCGMTEDATGAMHVVVELCKKGMLRDTLQNDKYNLDVNFKYSISRDVAEGMKYLHNVGIVHGNLTSAACWIDSRWTVKISDWQYTELARLETDQKLSYVPELLEENMLSDEDTYARTLLWSAPEVLEDKPATKESDCYSFSILLVEIFTREDPFEEVLQTTRPTEIIKAVRKTNLRPELPNDLAWPLRTAMLSGWSKDPTLRPTFSRFVKILDKTRPTNKSILDCMMESLDEYMMHLEEKIEEKTAETKVAMNQMKALLHQMLPPSVATKLSQGEHVQPESFDSITVFFSDIVGFTSISSESTPFEIVRMLNDLYMTFDTVIDNHEVYKVETIGDAYMVISGCPTRNGTDHAKHIASMAIDFAFAAVKFKIHHRPDSALQLRAGIHSGSACAGVVGHKMPRYCLFGDTVNTASRMESTSVAMKIQVSEHTQQLLQPADGFCTAIRGKISIKGKGSMLTYWLQGKNGMDPPMPEVFCRKIEEAHS